MTTRTCIIYLSLLLIFMLSVPASAQFNRIGGGLTFSPGVDKPPTYETGNPGINVRGVYELGDNFWAIPSMTFYIPKKRTDQYTGESRTTYFGSIDANMTYTLTTENTLLFYALGGLNLTILKSNFTSDDPDVMKTLPGINIGTGIEMIVMDDINAITQIKYVVGLPPAQYLVISVGIHYYITRRRFRTW